ncbi:BA14K-like protein [Ensifer adhaerens]|nr:BA14K-like protein [Ensifer adhaerens]HZG29577.1 BA14K family protein [Ensifer sp.]
MRTFLKVLAVSSALLVAAQAVPASAGDWGHRNNGDDMLAAGVAGLAAGVIAGAIVSGSQGPREVQTYEDVPQYRQRPVYDNGGDYGYRPARYNRIQPWTRDWYQLCEDRYDSFDPQSGTYIDGYGNERFCKIR